MEATAPRDVGRSAVVMGVATVISRSLGFVRVLVIAAVLGTTHLGNTFQGSNSVSNVFFELLAAGALSAVLVPVFVDLLDRSRTEEAEELAGALLGLGLVVMGVVAVAGVALAPVLARVLAAGVEDPRVAAQQRELSTFLLRFFVPQVLLYVVGAVSTAVLHAQRRFTAAAMAPIGNTLMVVGALLVFDAMRGSQAPSLLLTTGERVVLGIAGTLGVAAFVAVPAVALVGSGFRLRPNLRLGHRTVRTTLRTAVWGSFHNAGVGILLAAAILTGMPAPGGVVAYQVAFVFFLVPYAVLSQSVHTAILPELAQRAARGDRAGVARGVRWALDALALLVVPASAAYVALALPIMRTLSFGATTGEGARMIAGALAALAVGLFPYSVFLLLTRASYAVGDSRTPTIVSVASAVLGAVLMVVTTAGRSPEGRLVAIGLSHTAAYTVAAVLLWERLRRALDDRLAPRALLRSVPVAGVLAAGMWGVWRWWHPDGRLPGLALLVATGLAGALAYVAVVRPPSLRMTSSEAA